MSLSHSTFRLDSSDPESFLSVFRKYVKKNPTAKYVISTEISSVKHKEHFQGWVSHPGTSHAYQQYMSRHYKDYEPHQKSFTAVRKPDVYFSYILNNEMKPNVTYDQVYTNYDEDEFEQFKELSPFVSLPSIPKGRKAVTKTYQDKVLDTLEQKCVKNGKIQYTKIPHVYLGIAPQLAMDKAVARKNATGYTLRLENMYPDEENTLITDYLYDGIVRDDKGHPTPFSHFYSKADYNPDRGYSVMAT